MSEAIVNIYEYLEYRDFLRDHYEAQKKQRYHYSFRYISLKTGIDASFYAKILEKQKHLSPKNVGILAKFLKLDDKETAYFSVLVQFTKARSREQIQSLFDKLMTLRDPPAATIERNSYEYFKHWYTPAIRELLNFFPFDGDYAKLGASLLPQITARQAREAVGVLERLGVIDRLNSGGFRLTDQFVSTGPQWRDMAIARFQQQMSQLAVESVDSVPHEHRDISTLTVSTSWECLKAIRERLAEVRHEIMGMIKEEENVDEVFQINLQIFPLSRVGEKEGEK